jgi:hypothetical protein
MEATALLEPAAKFCACAWLVIVAAFPPPESWRLMVTRHTPEVLQETPKNPDGIEVQPSVEAVIDL